MILNHHTKQLFKTIILVLLFCFANACKDGKIDIGDTPKEEVSIADANVNFLEEDGIQLTLPEAFKRYSSAKYEALLKKFVKGKALELEQQRLRHLRKIDGNHYIFFDESTNSTITVNTIAHEPILKEDAKTILADIIRDQNEISKITKTEFEKISANYSESAAAQIFKTHFKVTDKKKKTTRYQRKYYISTKDKYMIMDINTASEIDFDQYLQKIKF